MSFNQSRSDRNETHPRKPGGRGGFNQQRSSTTSYGRGAGAGAAPSQSSSQPSNQSYNKKGSNAQGPQYRVNVPATNHPESNSNPPVVPRNAQNGSHGQSQFHGASDVPVASSAANPTDSSNTQRSTKVVPKAPTSQHAPMNVNGTTPTTPPKGPGDAAAKGFAFQFGSINPGLMNAVQVPARTSSAPPKLDEQKSDQARRESFRPVGPVPSLPMPAPAPAPKPQLPRKDVVTPGQSKKDLQVPPPTLPVSQTQKPSVIPIPMTSVQLPFQQPQVQFGVPNPPIQSQGMAAPSLQMAVQMQMANAPQQQPVLFQHHPMQSQGIMHQGQGLSFSNPMGFPMPHMSNMALGINPQYAQQQGGRFASPRKTTVKITDPLTHEELRLDKRTEIHSDGSSDARPHPNLLPQNQTFSPSHPMKYYSNSYTPNPMYYPSATSRPLTSGQMAPNSQTSRFNYPVSQSPQNVHSATVRDVHSMISFAPSGTGLVTVKPAAGSLGEKIVDCPLLHSSAAVEKSVPLKISRPQGDSGSSQPLKESILQQAKTVGEPSVSTSTKQVAGLSSTESQQSVSLSSPLVAPSEDPQPGKSSNEADIKESLSRSNSLKEHQKKKGLAPPQNPVVGQSTSTPTLATQGSENDTSSNTGITEMLGAKTIPVPSIVLDGSSDSSGPDTSQLNVDDVTKPDNRAATEGNNTEVCREEVPTIGNEVPTIGNEVPTLESVHGGSEEPVSCRTSADLTLSRSELTSGNEAVSKPVLLEEQSTHVPTSDIPEVLSESEAGSLDSASISSVSSKDKPTVELNRTIGNMKKKKLKELLQKKDAEGTTSDLYMAYKGPEERNINAAFSEIPASSEQTPTETSQVDDMAEKSVPNKTELEDWEDAVDISTPKLDTSMIEEQVNDNDSMGKKYSRDFLLKFAEHCLELPVGFDVTPDIDGTLMGGTGHVFHRDSLHSPGRGNDRSAGGSRIDDRWSKVPAGQFGSGNLVHANNASFRPGGQIGGNYGGAQRNPHVPYPGGILSAPGQSIGGPQAGFQRNNHEAEKWQRAPPNYFQQRGSIPSPPTPLLTMHKAERKYEVGKVTDEEQAKQRQLKGILNKLTPQNFDRLFQQVNAVNIDNVVTLAGVISQIFDKALTEPTFCQMYANFCFHLSKALPELIENNEKVTFKRLLLNKCQEEFERGEREEEEANQADEGTVNLSDGEREEKRVKARRRTLGNIRLIGELYKKRMLTERIMHECIKKLLRQFPDPDEEDVEALCKLMSTIGEMIDHSKAKEHMDCYFQLIEVLSNNMNLSSRVRFMLRDSIDLRSNKWQERRKVDGPKKIEEVHRDAAQERQSQTSRFSRNPPSNPSPRRPPMLSPPSPQMGSFRGTSPQGRGGGYPQDIRFEERHTYDPRTLSVLPQRPTSEESIRLGPQGGLARGMSRGPPTMSNYAVSDNIPAGPGDPRRTAPGLNGFGSMPERTAYSPRENLVPRHVGPAASDQWNAQDRSMIYANRPLAASPPSQGQGPALNQSLPAEKVYSEDSLRDMSTGAIKEFYSARDEKEVALCIKDLNSPSFHPSMISLWVNDSFERKDQERDLLASLLVSLTRSQDGVLNQLQLIKGFESVLTTLEDAVNDAPKAPEFLGSIFAKVVLENVVSLIEIGQLLREGGEERGSLLEFGLAGDVLGNTLEKIKSEKGEAFLNDIRSSSNLRVEDFQPPIAANRSRILEKFK